MIFNRGRLSKSSLVKTLQKNEFNIAALSLSVVALLPSVDFKVGIRDLTFVLDLTYVQTL